MSQRISLFAARTRAIARLGWSFGDRIRLGSAYVFYSILRSLHANYADRRSWLVHLNIRGKRVPLHLKGLLDLYILEGVVGREEYDLAMPADPKVIFDLGANTGIPAIYFKSRYPGAKLFLFEPDPSNLAILRKNTERFGDAVIYPAAVIGKGEGEIEFYQSQEHWSSSIERKKTSDRLVRVPAITLDRAMAEQGITSIDLLKFDIEGAEGEMLEHFAGLDSVNFIAGELHMDLAHRSLPEFYELLHHFTLTEVPLHGGRVTVKGPHERYAAA